MTVVLWALMGLCVAGIGFTSGWLACTLTVVERLEGRNHELTQHIVKMRKQGFVPQFEIEQAREVDPSEDVTEY